MIPVLDAAAFESLADDLGSRIASDFLTSFDALLTERVQRIEHALKMHDEEELITAILSLHASAAMAGATQLQVSATRALAHQPVGSTPSGPLVRKLQGQAAAFKDALATFHHAGYAPSIGQSPSSHVRYPIAE
ncbi:hypothetical protein [Arthrobacter burdickii]|uniref:HPt domain-containing protein n=1 Tax=Arthrobacter burdickii TaxID=3035920 RepID=A0ABT8JZJ7_9MICC|nr:hypothetical protein [Arthrobacter burdickii]MDN4609569.1 hypothetical protein [Arthrobacter burdickii]